MRKKKRNIILGLAVLVIASLLANISFDQILNIPNDFYINYQEIDEANKDHKFGRFVDLQYSSDGVSTGNAGNEKGEIIFKLFGLIPIKKVSVKVFPEAEVYVGGSLIGININTDGALVVSNTIVDATSGQVFKNQTIESGDIIQNFNGKSIKSVEDLLCALSENKEEESLLTLYRNGKAYQCNLPLLKDENGQYKLGVWVRDDFSGVGTLTFVDKSTGKFGALGHAITNGKDDNVVPMTNGQVYSCSLVNIEKGERNKPGELQCVFLEKNDKGKVNKNTKVGIFGDLKDGEGLIDANQMASLGGRLSVKPGDAKIISCVSGIREEYDIEIIKVNNQKACSDKSFVFRVKDKRLLELTGGIVQGMSGSPIMQNGKIIGAVTHVFISDATKGYGVYADWMLENLQ